MQLLIVAVGQRMPAWVDAAYADYAKRLPPEFALELREVKPEPRSDSRTALAALAIEAERIRAALPKRASVVILDERGREVSSQELSTSLQRWRENALPLALVIGGADGLDEGFKSEAAERLRLSSMTLPHGLARVLLVEQLYRAWSILQNHPYHRA
jgi:23S rRNA (pseudouridine1915-N3)-methyltransferase